MLTHPRCDHVAPPHSYTGLLYSAPTLSSVAKNKRISRNVDSGAHASMQGQTCNKINL
jgi:hypothetical protein